MLYVTTRTDRETFTVQHALMNDRGPDGGQFVPFHHPVFSGDEVAAMLKMPFEQCIAQVMNRIFGVQLSGWDVSFYAGRYPVRIQQLGHRLLIGQAWHNPDWCFERLAGNLRNLVSNAISDSCQWFNIGVRIAVFAAICGDYSRRGMEGPLDFALVSSDFTAPMAAWYARNWGFPIGNIICCCNENGNLWDLFSNGQMRTDGVSVPTNTPEADMVLPAALEQLIYVCGGTQEVARYLDACRQGGIYMPPDPVLSKLREGIYVSVVSDHRVMDTIPRVFASRSYVLSPYDALCHCGVSDYRTRYGETGSVLIFSERSPVCDGETVASAMNIPVETLKNYM